MSNLHHCKQCWIYAGGRPSKDVQAGWMDSFVCGFLKTSSTQGWNDNCYPELVISYLHNKPNQSTYKCNSLNIIEIEWLSIDEYLYQSFWIHWICFISLQGLESWQPVRDPGPESKLRKNGWLIYGSIEPPCFWKGLAVATCCCFAKQIIDSHRPFMEWPIVHQRFYGMGFLFVFCRKVDNAQTWILYIYLTYLWRMIHG